MATPHVTGAAALYASTHPNATAAQIKAAILASATPTASMAGRCVTGGRLNVGGF
jgi:subtilisin family serine protease